MSQQGMERLEAEVRGIVQGAEGNPEAIKTVLARRFKSDPSSIFSAWEDLAQIGSQPARRMAEEVEWARRLVNELLLRLGIEANDRWRNLVPVAQGIVDLIEREIQTYMAEDKWSGMLKIDCPACGKPVGQIHRDTAEGRTLAMRCAACGHGFDYDYQVDPRGPKK